MKKIVNKGMLKEMSGTNYQNNQADMTRPADETKVRLFHITAKGLEQSLLFFDEDDYLKIIDISAICSVAFSVSIVAYVHMSNHSHYVAACENIEDAEQFMRCAKRTYSQFCQRKRGINNIQRRTGITVKEIKDFSYLRNCIAYVLRNPVEARIVRHADQYRWSSCNCYFNRLARQSGRPVNEYSKRKLKKLLGTHVSLKGSNLLIDYDGHIIPESFVASTLVESLFGYSRDNLLRQIMKTDYYNLEYELTCTKMPGANDAGLVCEARKLAESRFGKKLENLDVKEKIRLVGVLFNRHRASSSQICRVLNIPAKLIQQIIPSSDF